VVEHPESWRAQYQLGYVLFRLHDVHGSVAALSKSLQLNLRNAEAHKVLGLDLTMLGDYDRAQLELEQAAAQAPDSAEIHYFLGRVYYTKNIFPLARREFEAAIKLDPTYMKAYDNLGLTLEAVGEGDAAVENWKRAIELCEQQGLVSEWPFINLAAYYNRQNDPQQALTYSQKAVEKNPKAAEAYFQMGRAHRSLHQTEQASEALQKAIANNPDNAEYHYVLSLVYRKLGKNAESQAEEAAFRRLKQKESAAGMGGVAPGRMDHRPPASTVDRNE
jgi:superkiller protein 3